MIPAAMFHTYVSLLRANESAAERFLHDCIASLPLDDRETAVESLCRAAADVVRVYGDNASTIAATFYDDLAEAAGVDVPRATLADAPDGESVRTRVAYAMDRALQADDSRAAMPQPAVEAAVSRAVGAVSRQANRTIAANATRDHVRYARVPTSTHPCAFCAMLASRGFEYADEHSATYRSNGDVLPACAGMIPSASRHANATTSAPRMRGDDPA